MVKDIVCGMQIDESIAFAKSSYQEKEYSFCSLICKERFDAEPEKYIKRENNK